MEPITALYGFSRQLQPFQGRSPAEAMALLQEWGVQAIFGGYDDPALVEAAHAAGIQVMAEFGCFVGERWWDRHPESRPVTAEGELLPVQTGYAGVNPTVPAVREELLTRLGALVRERELDGVWLDFIRWPSRWESPQPRLYATSFDNATLRRFQTDTGIALPASRRDPAERAAWILAEQPERWASWRAQQITSFVRQAAEVVRAEARRLCKLGMFSVPWRLDDFDGALLRIMGQDLRALAPYVDLFSPMVYHRMCGQPVLWIRAVSEEAHARTDKPVWPIIQTMNDPDALSTEELRQAMDAARAAAGSTGVILFTLKGLVEEDKLEVLQR